MKNAPCDAALVYTVHVKYFFNMTSIKYSKADCTWVSVRVLPLRWPRARLARAGSHGEGVSAGGYAGYQRPSLSTAKIFSRWVTTALQESRGSYLSFSCME